MYRHPSLLRPHVHHVLRLLLLLLRLRRQELGMGPPALPRHYF